MHACSFNSVRIRKTCVEGISPAWSHCCSPAAIQTREHPPVCCCMLHVDDGSLLPANAELTLPHPFICFPALMFSCSWWMFQPIHSGDRNFPIMHRFYTAYLQNVHAETSLYRVHEVGRNESVVNPANNAA